MGKETWLQLHLLFLFKVGISPKERTITKSDGGGEFSSGRNFFLAN